MRRLVTLMAVLSLAVTACGGDEGSSRAPATTAASVTTAAPVTTEPPSGDPAADFTLTLGGGGNFTLSDEPRPVYLVFWAEW